MRTILFGDVHGCYENLRGLLDKVAPRAEDQLIFVGDYFDRGPDSRKVYHLLKELQEKHTCVFIRGNHEQMILDYFDKTDNSWLDNGYEATLLSFKDRPEELMEALVWIRKNTVFCYSGDQFNACHAGTTEAEITDNLIDTVLWDRDPLYDGSYSGKLTIVGHTPMEGGPVLSVDGGIEPYEHGQEYDLPERGIIDIDTGGFAKVLWGIGSGMTAMVVEDGKMMFICADEKGNYNGRE